MQTIVFDLLCCIGILICFFITKYHFSILNSRYIDRNMEELEQITLKHSIGKRNKRQHASRESTIKIVHEQETALFRQSGFGKNLGINF